MGPDQVMDRSDVIVTVGENAVTVVPRGGDTGIRWLTPQRPSVSGQSARFADQGLEWTYATTATGIKLTATVGARQGPRSYGFSYELVGAGSRPLTLNDAGELVGTGFIVPPPSVVTADGSSARPGSWQLLASGRVGFDFDYSGLDPGALPYVIDPTTSFNPPANEGWGVTATSSTYPPTTGSSVTQPYGARSDYLPAGTSNGRVSCASACYAATTGLMRWDTSALPDDALAFYATVAGNIGAVDNADNLELNYRWVNWFPAGNEDYALPGGSIHADGLRMVQIQANAYNEIGFANENTDGISKTGFTQMHDTIGGATPTGRNGYSYTSAPMLKVTYCAAPVLPPGAYGARVLGDNPISYWSMDETSAGGACDTEARNHARIYGGVAIGQPSDISGTSMYFGGTSGYASLAGATSLQPTGGLSVEAWFKTTASPARAVMFRSRYYGYALEIRGTRLVGTVHDAGGGRDVVGPTGVTDGRWHHAMLTKDASGARLYLDGEMVGTIAFSGAIYYSGAGIAIGRDGDCNCDYFNGQLDEVAVYDHALSLTGAQTHAETGLYGRSNLGGGGPAGCGSSNIGAPITTSTGNFWHTFGDLAVPGRGPGLGLARTYNSAAADTNGPFGWGWASTYTMSASISPSGAVTIRQEAGDEVVFTPTPTGGYSAPSWLRATLVLNGDLTFTMTRRSRQRVRFSTNGRLLSITDLNNYATTLAYDGSGRLGSVTEPGGRTLSFAYGPNAKVASVTDPAGRQVSFYYDSSDNLIDVTDVGAGNTHFTYDGAHRMLSMRDPRGGVITNRYDSVGRVDRQVDAMNRVTLLDYTSTPGSTRVTDPRGNVTIDNYQRGLLTSQVKAVGTPQEGTWRWTYDNPTLKPTSCTFPNGRTIYRTYDAAANMLTSTDALGRTTRWTYNGFNNVVTMTDPNNVISTFSYDGLANLTQRSTPLVGTGLFQKVIFTRGDAAHPGDVTSITDPDAKVWSFVYDSVGNLTRVGDPLGNASAFGYDSVGRRIAAVSPRGTASGVTPGCTPPALGCSRYSYAYDATGELVTLTDPLGVAGRLT